MADLQAPGPIPSVGNDVATNAAYLCVVVLRNGKVLGRFAMTADELRSATGLPRSEIHDAISRATLHGWLGKHGTHLQLKAAGIYLAKTMLDLPR